MSDNELILIPEGEYIVTYATHHSWIYRGIQPKVTVNFEIIDHTEFFGVQLPRYYNAKRLLSEPEELGHVEVGKFSDCAYDYAELFNERLEISQVTFEEYAGLQILAEVTTVKKRHGGKKRPKCMEQSKVARLIRLVDG